MKKIITLILSVILLLSILSACNNNAIDFYAYDDLKQYIAVPTYKGIEFNTASEEIKEKIQDRYNGDLKKYNLYETITLPANTKVENGHTVVIDYVGKKDGVAFEGGTANDYSLEIGSGTFIEGFEEGLIGLKSGETKELNLTFPESYDNAELAGKAVVFTVTVKKIVKDNYYSLDEFGGVMASEMGYNSLPEYKEAVLKSVKSDYLWGEKIVDIATVVSYPEKELQYNKDYYQEIYSGYIESYGEAAVNEVINANANAKTKEELIAYFIAKQENITVDEEKLEETTIKNYGKDYTQKEKSETKKNLLIEKVIEFVIEKAAVK